MPNAVAVTMPPAHLPRIRPTRPAIWVRADGVWCSGYISEWVRLDDGTWLVWCHHPGGAVHAVWNWYVYDGVTVIARDGSAPPGE